MIINFKQSFFCLSFIFLCTPLTLLAQDFGPKPEPGWHVNVGLGAGIMIQERISQKTISSYEESPELRERYIPVPKLNIAWFDKDQVSHWAVKSRNSLIFAERHQNSGIGLFQFSYGHSTPDLGVEFDRGIYENPYILDEERKSTDITTTARSLKWVTDKKLGFVLEHQITDIVFDEDTTPSISDDLGRDGTRYNSIIGLNLLFVRYHYSLLDFNAKGAADSYDGDNHQLTVTFPLFTRKLLLISTATIIAAPSLKTLLMPTRNARSPRSR